MKRFTLFVCLLTLPALAFGQMTPAVVCVGSTAQASGNWSNPSTWDAGGVPTTGCAFIGTGYTVTVDIGTATCANLYLGSGSGFAVLKFNASSQLTVSGSFTWGIGTPGDSGTIDMTSGGTLILGGTVTVTAAQAHLYAGTGTIVFASNSGQTIPPETYDNLTLSGSGLKTTTGITVNGVLTMAGTATASAAPTYGGSSYLVYSGSAVQTTGAELPATMPQPVTINNSNDVVLSGSTTIAQLFFGGGNLLLGANTLTLGGSGGGAAATQCVVTNGTGYVYRSIATADSFTFPIGPSTTTYNPVKIRNNTGSTYPYTARVEVGNNPPTPDSTQAGNQTWTLTGNASGGPGVDLAFTWLTSEAGVNVTPGSAVAWEHNGTAWVQAGGTTATGTPNVTTVTGMGNLSPWIIGNPNALPIELASFTANAVSSTVTLEWMTISETNTLGFYVERGSSKTGPFTAVSSLIAGAGTSTAQHNYSYADNSVSSGTYYYRLHQVDKNGAGSYSSVITVTVSGVLGVGDKRPLPTEFALQQNYPNPFNPTTVVSYQLPVGSYVTLRVYNMLGQEVAMLINGMQEAGYKSVELDASNMPGGLYIYRLTAGTYTSVRKMLMIK